MNNTNDNNKKSKRKVGRPKIEYITGEGVEVQKIEKFCKLGMLVINKLMLDQNNKVQIRYPSGGPLAEFPVTIVSDHMANLLRSILKGESVNQRLLNMLPEEEKMLFYNLMKRCKLDSQLGLYNYKSEEDEKLWNRFILLKGMILAGNNSPEILKETKTLILRFMNNGTMKRSTGNQLLMEINSI